MEEVVSSILISSTAEGHGDSGEVKNPRNHWVFGSERFGVSE